MTNKPKPSARPSPQHLPFLTLLLLLLIAFHAFQGPVRSWFSGRYRAEDVFRRALDVCLDDYVEHRSAGELLQGALDGMVESLNDPHSAFLPPTANQRLGEEEAGKYAGIGVEIQLKDERLVIRSVFDGSPAAKAGLRAGDVIVSAAEHDPDGLKEPVVHDLTAVKSLGRASMLLRGLEGSKVTLGVLRGGKRLEFTVERDEIERPVVEARLVGDGIGYLRIRDFPDGVSGKVREALAGLRKQHVRALVLDLRRNVGGFLDEAVRVADLFIPDGVIVSTVNRYESENRVFRASPGGPAEDLPLAVLVDGGTASAAEVLSGTLQDHGRARLVGTKTFGKGAVSKRFSFPDGSGILLSTGRYILPKGRQIEGKGLEPDLVVEPPEREAEPSGPQFDAAVKLLREQLAPPGA